MEDRLTVRSALCLGLSILLVFQGCASYTAPQAPMPTAETMRVSRTVGQVTAGADPYVAPDRRKAVVDTAPNDVLPIQVLVQNHGPEPLRVRYSDIVLELPNGNRLNPKHRGDFSRRPSGSSSLSGSDLLSDPLSNPLTGILFFLLAPVLIPMAIVGKRAEQRPPNYSTKEFHDARDFRDVTLEPEAAAHGFVFFYVVDSRDVNASTLIVRIRDAEGAHTPVEIRLPLSERDGSPSDAPLPEAPR